MVMAIITVCGMAGKRHDFMRGFTVYELLIVLSIIAIFSALAAPAMRELTTSTHTNLATEVLHATLRLAQSEAIKRNAVVRVCPSSDAETCSTARKWEIGWLVYVDASGKATRKASDPILHIGKARPYVRIHGPRNTIKFNGNGRGSSGSLSLCTVTGRPLRRIVFSSLGRIRVVREGIVCDE